MVKAQAGGGPEFFITGDIGYDVDADTILQQLSAFKGEEVTFTILSYGGAVFPAIAVYEYVRDNNIKATANIYGICASAATLFMAAAGPKRTYVSPHSQCMFHSPFFSSGEGNDTVLKNTHESLLNIYMESFKISRRAAKTLMESGDTFLTAQEMQDRGFGKVMDEMAIAAKWQEQTLNLKDMSEEKTTPEEEKTPTSTVEIPVGVKDLIRGSVVYNRDEDLDYLKGEVENMMAEQSKTTEIIADFESEVTELKAKFTEIEKDRDQANENLDEAKAELKASLEANEALEGAVEDLRAEVARLEKLPAAEAEVAAGDDIQDPGTAVADDKKGYQPTDEEIKRKEMREKYNEQFKDTKLA